MAMIPGAAVYVVGASVVLVVLVSAKCARGALAELKIIISTDLRSPRCSVPDTPHPRRFRIDVPRGVGPYHLKAPAIARRRCRNSRVDCRRAGLQRGKADSDHAARDNHLSRVGRAVAL